MNSLTKQHDYSISIIRMTAMLFIVTCHIMQYLNCPLAFWFNVGVQMFLCISGFLYGKKQVTNDVSFFKKQFVKILVDYYIVIIPAVLLLLIFAREEITGTAILKAIIAYDTLPGGGHLWYIPYCLLCYLITPFLSRYFEKESRTNGGRSLLLLTVFLITVAILIENFFSFFNSAWIICYIIGFFLGKITERGNLKLYKATSCIIILLAFLSNSIQIAIDYLIRPEFSEFKALAYELFRSYAHVTLGISIFILMRSALSIITKNKLSKPIVKMCDLSDKYSYDIYLVHLFFILGPFSLMALTPSLPINILLIIICIFVSSVFVNFLSCKIQTLFNKE